jgi:1-acyl-sn-glycerol-3-phosphate acyltransferase
MMAWLSKLILRCVGWKITGTYDNSIKKKILIVAPHTSNWDFPLGLLVRSAIKDKIQFVGKDSLFKPPFGFLMKAIGGIPVDRSRSTNFVRAVVNEYNKRDKMTIVIAPEGSRKKVNKFKTGFYFIAKAADVPIIKVKFDYTVKEVHFDPPFYPTEDSQGDIAKIENHFRGIKGHNAEKSFD